MEQLLSAFPPRLKAALGEITQQEWTQLEEIRLHTGQNILLCFSDRTRELTGTEIRPGEGGQMLELACRASVHTVLPQLRQGYLTLRGGHRLGICGSVHLRDGDIRSIEPISSLNLRLARQVRGAAQPLIGRLCPKGAFRSTLILAPPGAGKTTLLRDLLRCLSDGVGCCSHRVSLADERGEVAAVWQGAAQLDVGRRTDILEGCPKAQALMLLLRGMNPEVLAADEITAPEDVRAMSAACGCGVRLLGTAHGKNREDLCRRKLYRDMMDEGVFESLVTISVDGGVRRYKVEELK